MAIRCEKPTGRRFIDMTGEAWGRLTIIKFWGRDPKYPNKTLWQCECDCGRRLVVRTHNIRNGHTVSCGCFMRESCGNNFRTHGKSGFREHRIWTQMLNRCLNVANPAYDSYGGRGIYVVRRWLKFENFFADMGVCPQRRSLDRLDNDGPYCKRNCAWRTQKQQNRNKRNNHLVTYGGRTQTVAGWAEELGFEYGTLLNRLKAWQDADRAFRTPLMR